MKIIHEDKNFLVVDKESGQLVLPIPKSAEKTLRDELLEKYPELADFDPERAGLVHRLDRETSGLLLVAKNKGALKFLQGEFGARRVKKEYVALAHGEVKQDNGTIDLPLGRARSGKIVPHPRVKKAHEAKTDYEAVERLGGFTLLRVKPLTGRTHQVRAHLGAIGHPVVGDRIYDTETRKQESISAKGGSASGGKAPDYSTEAPRLFLHASKLEFYDPDAKWRVFESKLPEDLEIWLANLRKQRQKR